MQPRKLKETDVLKKLQKSSITSPQQYELIIKNLEEQNQRLSNDYNDLQIRVKLLAERQKQMMEQETDKGYNPKTDYGRIKAELDRKYKQFHKWQKKSYKSLDKSALHVQCRTYLDHLTQVENQIRQLKKAMVDEKKSFKKLQKAIKEELKFINKNLPQRQALEEENKELRKLIWNMRIVDDLRNHVEVRIQDNKIGYQEKSRIQRVKTVTIEEVKNEEVPEKLNLIQKDRERAKRIKTMMNMSPGEKQKIIKKEKRGKLKEEKKNLNEKLVEIENKKRNLENTLKQLHRTYEEQEERKLKLNEDEIVVETCDVCLQVNQFEDEEPLRKQFIGVQTPYFMDDRLVLKNNKNTYIVGFIYLQSKSGLGLIKALYSNGKETEDFPFKQKKNTKYKNTKIMLKQNDYIKWVKAYYSRQQQRICRIQFYSFSKQKYQMGEKKEEMMGDCMAYKFDNSTTQTPVCLNCSYRPEGADWVLASFGVEFSNQ